MKKTLLVVALAAITMLASSSDAFAQRRGGGGGRGGYGYGGRGGYGYGGRGGVYLGLGAPYYGGYYGGRYYDSGYGSAYYSQPYYYSDSPNYYTDSAQVPATDIRQSFYSDPVIQQQSSQQTARVMVRVPSPNAQIWFDGSPTSQQGMERVFNSPALDPGSSYVYTVKARWTENGQTRDREQRVSVQAGQSATVDFRGNSSEAVPLPLPKRQ